MASNGEVNLESQLDRLSIASEESLNRSNLEVDTSRENEEIASKWGFHLKDLYRLALRFYKEKEGKAVHLSYEDKLKLVALTCQVSHGKLNQENMSPVGVLDVIGRDRRVAWQALGSMTQEEAMYSFVELLDKLCPLFQPCVEAHKRDLQERERLAREEADRQRQEEERLRQEEEQRQRAEEERLKQEIQRRQVQEALNRQTYHQFKSYAEQQYPGNPEQQAVLIRQLQEQHYHQYMQQLYHQQQARQQPSSGSSSCSSTSSVSSSHIHHHSMADPGTGAEEERQLLSNGTAPGQLEGHDSEEELSQGEFPSTLQASMWTRKDIKEFKDSIRKEGGDAIIKVGHGETVTVRVPTHEDGTCLFWEFATDSYDIGFGVYFEWTKSTSNQVSVHISESEDEDEDEDEDDEDLVGEDVERGSGLASGRVGAGADTSNRPPLSIIVPVFRRDCQEEVYAGSHVYPGQGVYLLKFDNSYSLWRSKTLYYRVYYTR